MICPVCKAEYRQGFARCADCEVELIELLPVTGEFDEICPLYKLEPFVEQLKGPKGIKVIIGARHLMRGYEEAAVTTILKFVKNWAEMPGV